jgi:hypothetical protein
MSEHGSTEDGAACLRASGEDVTTDESKEVVTTDVSFIVPKLSL